MQISNFFDTYYSVGYKKVATDFADALWDILSYAKHYSFAENPLPIFYILHARYCDLNIDLNQFDDFQIESTFATINNNPNINLLKEFPKGCFESTKEDCEFFDYFCSLLNFGYIYAADYRQNYSIHYCFRRINYKLIHPFVVEYFIQKYIHLHKSNYEFSESFIDKIRDKLEFDCDYYIPYSGFSSIALFLLNYSYDWEAISLSCSESNPMYSLISKVRLCSYGHNCNLISSSFDVDKNATYDFYTKAIISVPPIGLKVQRENSNGELIDIDAAEDLITRFIEDDKLDSAYLVLPMNFARSSKFKEVRQKLVEGKLIRSIDLIPEGSFMSSSTAGILICLGKRNDSDTIKFIFEEGKYTDILYKNISINDFVLDPMRYYSDVKIDGNKRSYHIDKLTWQPTIEQTETTEDVSASMTSDLIHCLGPIFNRINSTIEINSDNDDFKLIKDNISYMTRVIKAFGADFSSYRTNKEEIGVNDFFQEYYSSLQSCNSSIFKVEYNSELSDDTTFEIDEDVVRIMLDTILDNAYRHGFKKAKDIDARVGITTSCKKVKGRDYILIEVANNGLPFPNDLTFEKFITRGEFCGENGHTGLGGNHIFNIIKLHDGYLNVTKSAKWNVIFDVLIPAEYISDEDMNNITDYENEDWCV